MSLNEKVSNSIPPSWYVRSEGGFTVWSNVTSCSKCGLLGKYEDHHPVNPCRRCGHKPLDEAVGRWVELPRPWWLFWKHAPGYWELLKCS